MRLARFYLILVPAFLGACEDSSSPGDAPVPRKVRPSPKVRDLVDFNNRMKIIEDDSRGLKEPELPILPPIILLDFANDLANSSLPGEEKSKRTVDSSLGYGFGRNNFFTGKYNYYFPAGKSGTSVSIEESVTPFLPKTIVESIKPITEKPEGERINGYSTNTFTKNAYQSSDSQIDSQSIRASSTHFLGTQPVYGQRTKLYKPSPIDYTYRTFADSPRANPDPAQAPDNRQNSPGASQNAYATPAPPYQSNYQSSGFFDNSQTSSTPYKTHSTQSPPSYVTPTESPYRNTFSVNGATARPSFDQAPTTHRPIASHSPTESPLAAFADLPRYTIENGVRYENKIVWKYPDGKVSQLPPTSYVNAYNEFLTKQRPGSYDDTRNEAYQAGGSGQTGGPRHAGGPSQTFQRPYQSSLIGYPSQENRYRTESNIHSKSPAQFPNDEPTGSQRPSQFVSSAQAGHGQQAQAYESSFQGHYGQKTQLGGGYSTNDEPKDLKDSYGSTTYVDHRPVSKYAINSPNPEYTYTTESSVRSTSPASPNLFTPSGQLSPKVLSKYTTQAQKYLTKVFATGTSGSAASTSAKTEDQAANHHSLFGYNPSLAQYIRDPTSILKAQPTFIQAGNSLIPVIILRVDGVPPIQPKVTPNINLKALLQQYLTQYAGSLAQNTNYETNNYRKQASFPSNHNTAQNPLYELTQLAQSLSHYSRNPTFNNHFAQQYEDDRNSYESSYTPATTYLDHNSQNGGADNYQRKTNKQKVKSVQIIEDPRFTSYKVNS